MLEFLLDIFGKFRVAAILFLIFQKYFFVRIRAMSLLFVGSLLLFVRLVAKFGKGPVYRLALLRLIREILTEKCSQVPPVVIIPNQDLSQRSIKTSHVRKLYSQIKTFARFSELENELQKNEERLDGLRV